MPLRCELHQSQRLEARSISAGSWPSVTTLRYGVCPECRLMFEVTMEEWMELINKRASAPTSEAK